MTYVDGYVVPVKKERKDEYFEIARKAGALWMKHGALEYKECILEDASENEYCVSFPQAFSPLKDEVIVFSYIVFRSRKHRDEVNEKVSAEMEVRPLFSMDSAPFDCPRMIYSGFRTIVGFSLA